LSEELIVIASMCRVGSVVAGVAVAVATGVVVAVGVGAGWIVSETQVSALAEGS